MTCISRRQFCKAVGAGALICGTSSVALAGQVPARRTNLTEPEFPGYNGISLTKSDLDRIVTSRIESWRSALSISNGVLLITDTLTGKLYVESAYGRGGIWERLCVLSITGHGGNRRLKELIESDETAGASRFLYSIIDTTLTSDAKAIAKLENHWKTILQTREHGLNEC